MMAYLSGFLIFYYKVFKQINIMHDRFIFLYTSY